MWLFGATRYRNKEGTYHGGQDYFVVRSQSVFFRRRIRPPNDEVVQIQRHIALHMTIEEKVIIFFLRSKGTSHFRGGSSKRRKSGREHTSRRVVILDFKSSMTFQSYDRARSRPRYGKPILSSKMYSNSVISFPPTFRRILDKDGISRKRRDQKQII